MSTFGRSALRWFSSEVHLQVDAPVAGSNVRSLPAVGRVTSQQLGENNMPHLQAFAPSDGLIGSLFLLLAAVLVRFYC